MNARLGATLLALLLGCTGADARADPCVVLISLDGTRVEDVAELPTFARIAAEGVGPMPLRPVFPTNTFPNHVSLVTGVEPARHGIVNNTFADPERGTFRYSNDPDWIEVPPLWTLLSRAGRRSAAFHWVGSQGDWKGEPGPGSWRAFDSSVPESEKAEQIVAWLSAPPGKRPHLITAWFRGADGIGHREGPGTAAAERSLHRQDAALGRIVSFLDRERRWSETTLILVSDHGMEAVQHRVDLAKALDNASLRAALRGGGGFGTITLHRGGRAARGERVAAILSVALELGLEAWERGRGPEGLDDDHPRFGDVLVMAPPGTGIARAGALLRKRGLAGSHGYRPELPAMQALFAAIGRGVATDAQLDGPRVIDVAPTVLQLLGIEVPAWMEGRPLALGADELAFTLSRVGAEEDFDEARPVPALGVGTRLRAWTRRR